MLFYGRKGSAIVLHGIISLKFKNTNQFYTILASTFDKILIYLSSFLNYKFIKICIIKLARY